MTLPFNAGDAVPLNITDWQLKYSDDYGNNPTLLITEDTVDEFGQPTQREIPDATIFRYKTDNLLTRIKIIIGSGILSNNTYITIKR